MARVLDKIKKRRDERRGKGDTGGGGGKGIKLLRGSGGSRSMLGTAIRGILRYKGNSDKKKRT